MAPKSKSPSYRQPRSVNIVSVAMVLLLGAAAYWVVCFGPAYFKLYRVKQLVHEAASKYYKLSFLEKGLRAQETNKLVNETRQSIVGVLGFDDPEMTVQLLVDQETKKVNVVAQYSHTVELIGLNRRRILRMRAVGESDFKPNEW
ncbi:MAG: hypothetical protein RMK29_10370 [Myxococcales bacterium]|nr:hypothetical protein [Myxococcota bacterium]MDW8282107.1 hypothetical protein [Myxococcales bacterium]